MVVECASVRCFDLWSFKGCSKLPHCVATRTRNQEGTVWTTDFRLLVSKSPSLHSRRSNSKFLGTTEAYFVRHIGPNFQISMIYAFIGCPSSVSWTISSYYFLVIIFERISLNNCRLLANFLDKIWADFGQNLSWLWTYFELTLVDFGGLWANFRWTLDRIWADFQ